MSVQAQMTSMTARRFDSGLDRWLQRAAILAMVSVGLVLLAIGVTLFREKAPRDISSSASVSEEALTVTGDLP